jgi:hypothetical protein
MIFRSLATLFLCAPALLAQPSVGIIGGVPFNNLTNGATLVLFAPVDKSGMYTIGPSFQLGLPFGFRVEADALYRPLGVGIGSQVTSSSQWRFPVLAQYRFSGHIFKPFVEAGYSYDHVNFGVALDRANNVGPVTPSGLSITSHHGFVLGAGLDFKVPFLRISPEIRYTHDTGAANLGNLLNTNQAEFLVGVRF